MSGTPTTEATNRATVTGQTTLLKTTEQSRVTPSTNSTPSHSSKVESRTPIRSNGWPRIVPVTISAMLLSSVVPNKMPALTAYLLRQSAGRE